METVGNHLALDLLNTQTHGPGGERDALQTYEDLVGWLAAMRVLTGDATSTARGWAGTADADRALAEARAVRAATRAIAEALSKRTAVDADAIETINAHLVRPISTSTIAVRDGVPVRDRRIVLDTPDDLVVPLAEAARDLLLDADPALVRQCAAKDCIRWFYDTSKRHGRTWCTMASCGNRMKAAAHRERRRASESAIDTMLRQAQHDA
jgi:predicted RNA-binding Zn ribbon-like protein